MENQPITSTPIYQDQDGICEPDYGRKDEIFVSFIQERS